MCGVVVLFIFLRNYSVIYLLYYLFFICFTYLFISFIYLFIYSYQSIYLSICISIYLTIYLSPLKCLVQHFKTPITLTSLLTLSLLTRPSLAAHNLPPHLQPWRLVGSTKIPEEAKR